MFVIVIYDIEAKRTARFHKFLKKRLNWIQNSVFEGELLESEFYKVKSWLKKNVKKEESVIIYTLFSVNYLDKISLGRKELSQGPSII